ncbi:MAG: lysylphosphatidylglycerol synthase transmembrane domain-containing protein [Patescibacteria group bacterium]
MKSFDKKIKFFLRILGPIIFLYILSKIDYQLLFKKLGSLKWSWLILAFVLMILEIIARSLRWQTILNSLKIFISKINSLTLYWLGAFVSVITPGRLGEVIKVYFLKHKNYSVFRSLLSIILDRIIDILIILILGALISFFFVENVGLYVVVSGVILVLAIIFVFLLIGEETRVNKIFTRLVQKFFSIDFGKYGRFTFAKLWQGIKNLKKKDVVCFLLYLIIGWLFYFLARYIIALSLNLDLSFLAVSIISILATIVTILPISIAGIGTREAAIIYLFGLFGINKEPALLFSLLILTIDMVVISLGFIPYLKESSLINRAKTEKVMK